MFNPAQNRRAGAPPAITVLSTTLALIATLSLLHAKNSVAATVFINELHYDNSGSDQGEAVEIAAPDNTVLTGWALLFYNGANGRIYHRENLSGQIFAESGGFGVRSFSIDGIQNGPADAIALLDAEQQVVEFISYEGQLTATEGAAAGWLSEDIGIAQTADTTVGLSLQRHGNGLQRDDFFWQLAESSFGQINTGQQFIALPLPSAAALLAPTFLSVLAGVRVARRRKLRRQYR